MKSFDEKAFDSGMAAFERGTPLWANPYRGEGLRCMWEFGWRDARAAARWRRRHPSSAVAASKVETRPAADAIRSGTGRRAPAQAPESGTPINPPLSK